MGECRNKASSSLPRGDPTLCGCALWRVPALPGLAPCWMGSHCGEAHLCVSVRCNCHGLVKERKEKEREGRDRRGEGRKEGRKERVTRLCLPVRAAQPKQDVMCWSIPSFPSECGWKQWKGSQS
eukprot:1159370-Pelagomonas_calceolata.AAC.1